MKKALSLLLALVMCLTLCSCGHSHTWNVADCITPKTCNECGETEGVALGHTWSAATCVQAKTCSVCDETEGVALGHTWNDATCVEAKTCSICGEEEGEALGHSWNDATCTEARKCAVCGQIDGEALGHDTAELTCTKDITCPRCGVLISAPGHDFSEATCYEPAKCRVCGEVNGKALGHTSSNGICARCGLESYITVSGRGDDVLPGITVGDGVYRVHFTHSGKRNFIVKSYDATNDKELLINEIGKYDGYVLLRGKTPYSFEITADGAWSYTIERLGNISATTFSGKGDYVTGLCSLSSGAWKFTHDGRSNFIVKVYTTDGYDLLVNEIGVYEGKKMVTIPVGSYAVFEIIADGNWSIEKA